eukprot:Pompholyxophrys_punicea_v1_NODE_321_length_2256_cov_7.715129.p1 type:complete len:361 gc:universal NODE_321_length_2256_cov_7.715129:2076-994(-)
MSLFDEICVEVAKNCDLFALVKDFENEKTLFVTSKEPHFTFDSGRFDLVRLRVKTSGHFTLSVLLTDLQTGIILNVDEFKYLLKVFDGHQLCNGIQNYDSIYGRFIHVDPDYIKRVPSQLGLIIRSQACSVLFPVLKRYSEKYLHTCENCKEVIHTLNCRIRKVKNLSEEERLELQEMRMQPSSRYSLDLLSPNEVKEKFSNLMCERKSLLKKLEKFKPLQVRLSQTQNEELREVVQRIDDEPQFRKILEDIFKEADVEFGGKFTGKGDILRSLWHEDTLNKDKDDFEMDEMSNSSGNRGYTWSAATYRLALSVFVRSTAAYEALKEFKILSLPSVRTLQNIVRSHYYQQGLSLMEHLKI